MKVLFLTQTGQLGPASRYRVYQLIPFLQKLGIESEVSPAIDDERYKQLYFYNSSVSRVATFCALWKKRRANICCLGKFDAAFVQKGFSPGLYSGLETKIAARIPLVFDFDDAVWLPRQGGSALLRALHREGAVQKILRRAAAITAGNDYLAAYARRFNSNVIVVPTALNVASYHCSARYTTIGWIGSRTTLPYLKPLAKVFSALDVKPRVIASGDHSTLGFDVEFRPWNLENEMEELSQIGIGIAPLSDTPWERGKCGVKVLQYMACGIPVVASPVGVHKEMIRHGETGFLANTTEEWIEYLRQLIADPLLRQRLGTAGRKTVEERYSLEKIAPKLAAVLKSVASH